MTQPAWTPLDLVSWTADYFGEHGVPSPRLDAEVLLAHVLGVARLDLYLQFERTVSADERARYRELVRERATERVPVAYLVGEREFWSKPFAVTRDVLIPRPETELLVEMTQALAPRKIAEIGVGSGAVTGSLACALTESEFVATDCSEPALAVAARNFESLGVAERIRLVHGEGPGAIEGPYDALISNPPYVPSAELELLEPELAHEPRIALDGGPDGLDFIRRLVAAAPELIPGGFLLLEIGAGQTPAVQALLNDAGAKEVEVRADLAGIDRIVCARFGPEVERAD